MEVMTQKPDALYRAGCACVMAAAARASRDAFLESRRARVLRTPPPGWFGVEAPRLDEGDAARDAQRAGRGMRNADGEMEGLSAKYGLKQLSVYFS